MTNGTISTTVTAGTAGMANMTAAPGKTSSSNGFSGVLVQAMGGTDGNGATAAGNTTTAGLLGWMGLLGAQPAEQAPELLQLLAGLSEQLEGLDPNAELPADVQDQLAGLLGMLQNLLMQMGIQPNADSQPAGAAGTDASQSPLELTSGSLAANGKPVSSPLQQTLKQLSALLSSGAAVVSDPSGLTEQIRQAIQALTPHSASVQTSQAQPVEAQAASNASQNASKLMGQGNSAAESGTEIAAASAPEIRRSTGTSFRNPVWTFQTAQESDSSSNAGIVTPSAVQPGEAAGENGSAPAWTFLKGDNAGMTPSVPANATAASTNVPVQQFAEHMSKYLVKQFVLTQAGGAHEAKILLHPEHLGQVDIKIMIQNGQLTAQFVTENGAARDLLENQLSQLRTALQGQGLQVDRMEVVQQSSTAASDTASMFQQNQRQPGSGHHGGANGRGLRGTYDDQAGFEAELDRTASLREIGYGSALNVKA
ncbi:hypothetical protein E5161_04625 [Cohnella pontilimi]|uniref:Flagellar hook-length control protein-like C-terminal domain-containing protein n=1 Tax=Cohnella pontilimi TaxID=2564100 RepID=A0A4U0FE24_9BACL|nr:flagellar hook-length control protein FliK [Cohnella pontilimi]TJY43186.1 hypothetical protein E5161_04625 [Cohnella pontilimi]